MSSIETNLHKIVSKLSQIDKLDNIDKIKEKVEEVYEMAKTVKTEYAKEKRNFENEYENMMKKSKKIDEISKKMIKLVSSTNGKITLNVGGEIFVTSKSTLVFEKETFFTAMFSEYFDTKPDEKGQYFIDRSPKHFSYILDYLRDPERDLTEKWDEEDLSELLEEAQFYSITSLEKKIMIKMKKPFYHDYQGVCDISFNVPPAVDSDLEDDEFVFTPIYDAMELSDGRIAALFGKEIKIWDVSGTPSLVLTLKDDTSTEEVAGLVELPNGTFLVPGFDGINRIYDQQGNFTKGAPGIVVKDCAHPPVLLDKDRLVYGADNTMFVLNAQGKVLEEVGSFSDNVRCIHVMKDGRIASCSDDGTVAIWNLKKTKEDGPDIVFKGHNSPVCELIVHSSGTLISVDEKGDIILWNWDGSIKKCVHGHVLEIFWIRELFDSRIVTAGRDGMIRFWDINGNGIDSIRTPETINALTQLRDSRILTGHMEGNINIWK